MKTALQLVMETIYNTNMCNSYNIETFLSRTLLLRTLAPALAITDTKPSSQWCSYNISLLIFIAFLTYLHNFSGPFLIHLFFVQKAPTYSHI